MAEDTSDAVPARFRKTKNDTWAVMAPIEALEKALAEGGKIDVQKKSGDWSTFVVGSLGKPFDVDGIQMCYGYPPQDDDDAPTTSGGGQSSQGRNRTASSRPRSQNTNERSAAPARANSTQPPPPDPTEPLPEYRGGPEDEWDGGF